LSNCRSLEINRQEASEEGVRRVEHVDAVLEASLRALRFVGFKLFELPALLF
jgi:hypothetical protein